MLFRSPLELRLRHVKDARDIAVLKAAAEKANWQSRPSPRRDQTGNQVSGRGIAYSQRSGTRCAIVAEVDINRSTGKIYARKFVVAHDCGQIINPDGLKHAIEGIHLPPLPDGWWYHGPRLAFQPVLIWWALFCSNVIDWPFRRPER